MPSASTTSPMSGSVPNVSSLCSRTRPVSVMPTQRSLPLRCTDLRPGPHGERTQCSGELGTVVEPFGQVLGQRAVHQFVDPFRQVRPHGAHACMRLHGDFHHCLLYTSPSP